MLAIKYLTALCSLWTAVLAEPSTQYPKSITLSYEILGPSVSSIQPLAQVLYDPATLKYSLASWTPPSLDGLKSTSPEPASYPLVRVSLPDGSATVTSLGSFDNKLSQYIDLWFSQDDSGSVFSASITSTNPPPLTEEEERQRQKEERLKARGKAVPSPKGKSKTKKSKPQPEEVTPGPVVKVTLRTAGKAPTPKLISRAPPQIDSEGREIAQEDQPEKSFFQKYWYFFAIAAVVLMGGAGGEK